MLFLMTMLAAAADDPLLSAKTREAVADRLARVRVEIVESEAELGVLKGHSSPETLIALALALQSAPLVPLIEAMADAESELASLQTRYGEKMPEVVAARARVENERSLLQKAVDAELASRAIRLEMLRATQAALQQELRPSK